MLFLIQEAEYKEFIAATDSRAGLRQQMLLDSIRKDKLAVLAVSCYTDISLYFYGQSL